MLTILSCKGEPIPKKSKKLKKPVLRIAVVEDFRGVALPKVMFAEFEKTNNVVVEVEAFEDHFSLLEKVKSKKATYDVVMGIDESFRNTFLRTKIFLRYQPVDIKTIPRRHRFDRGGYLTPYSFSFVTILVNDIEVDPVPQTLGEIQENLYKNQIIFPNPHATALGKIFYAKTIARFSLGGHTHFWTSIRQNIRTIQLGERKSYNILLAREGSIIIGYNTYAHFTNSKNSKVKLTPVFFDDFYTIQHFASAICSNSDKTEVAKSFVDYTITENFQNQVADILWKYPVLESASLPDEFKVLKASTSKDAVSFNYIVARVDAYYRNYSFLFKELLRRKK